MFLPSCSPRSALTTLRLAAIGCALVTLLSAVLPAADTPASVAPGTSAPLAGWDGTPPESAAVGAEIDAKLTLRNNAASVEAWRTMKLQPSKLGARQAEDSRAYWVAGEGGSTALALATAMSVSIYAPAARAAFLECSEGLQTPLQLKAATLAIRFRLTGGFARGGNTGSELDGLLFEARPGFALLLQGRGTTAKAKRLPILRVAGRGDFLADLPEEIPQNSWQSLTAVWQLPDATNATPAVSASNASDQNSTEAEALKKAEVVFYCNGVAYPGRKIAGAPAVNKAVTVSGPLRVGGDGTYAVAPMELASFALYDRALSAAEATSAGRDRSFERHPEADQPAGWSLQNAEGVSLAAGEGQTLELRFLAESIKKPARLLLQKPLLLDDAQAVQFWLYQPRTNANQIVQLSPIFLDAKGKEIALPERKNNGSFRFVSTHIAPPNGRKGAAWHTLLAKPMLGAVRFAGFEVVFDLSAGQVTPDAPGLLYLKDFGLDRIRYDNVPLYYCLSNYRDNYAQVAFNGCAAKPLSSASTGLDTPFLLLDNAVDSAKEKRPATLTLRYCVYDEADRPVYQNTVRDLPARAPGDLLRRLPVPLCAPGTYRIQSRSYNAATGEYFTTEWTQLIIIRGHGTMRDLPACTEGFPLSINPNKPVGRLEPTDPRRLDFALQPALLNTTGATGVADASGTNGVSGAATAMPNLALQYGVIAYQAWIPGLSAKLPAKLERSLKLPADTTAATVLSAPYEPTATVDLVMAELRAGNLVLDRAEKLTGIRNELAAAPAPDPTIPTLNDLAGAGKIWMNSQLHTDADTGTLEYFQQHIGEIKKVTTLIGFSPRLDRLQPIPGVYNWDYLQAFFDLAAVNGCRMVPYLAQKWPASWAPVDFFETPDGRAHDAGIVWRHMIGGYNYATGQSGPELLRQFNQQLARRFVNHPGFGAYYFENEHIISWSGSLATSHDEGNRVRFTRWLQQRYDTIDALNRAYGTSYASFDEARIPDETPVRFPRRIMHADLQEYMVAAVEAFVLGSQFDAVRKEDPRRPILIYHPGQMTAPFYRHLAENGGMLANGGVHSDIDVPPMRETYNAIPGLLERMEPHDMWNYQPILNGFDEMIFGMLAMGGRGLNFHFFLQPKKDWSFEAFRTDPRGAFGLIQERMPALLELRDTEKIHDAVSIVDLRKARSHLRGAWTPGHRPLTTGVYIHSHYLTKYHTPGGEMPYLNGTRLFLLCGEVIDRTEAAYLKQAVQNGAYLALTADAASISLEDPDRGDGYHLVRELGIDPLRDGTQLPGLAAVHDAYPCGKGGVVLLREGIGSAESWEKAMPVLTKWAGLQERLADSDDRFMQMITLQKGATYYLAVTHRGRDQNAYNGPKEWEGKVRFLKPLPEGKYRVVDLWNAQPKEIGVFTPQQLAAGFSAGAFTELQMKIFRIEPVR